MTCETRHFRRVGQTESDYITIIWLIFYYSYKAYFVVLIKIRTGFSVRIQLPKLLQNSQIYELSLVLFLNIFAIFELSLKNPPEAILPLEGFNFNFFYLGYEEQVEKTSLAYEGMTQVHSYILIF